MLKIAVSELKARCTEILRNLREPIEITRRGKVVAVISPPPSAEDHNPIVGCLKGVITYGPDWDAPLGEADWEAYQ